MHWTVLLLIFSPPKNENNLSLKTITGSSSKGLLFELRWNLFQVSLEELSFQYSKYSILNNFLQANHMKQYRTRAEQMKRKLIFSDTVTKIESHNERYYQGLETYKMGVNHFSDLTEEEFEKAYAGNNFLYREDLFNETILSYPESSVNDYDKEPNWYTPKIPVKNQGDCGSCWTLDFVVV